MGVLIFEGMKVGVIDGDFTVCVDEHGKMDSKLILSTSYNVLPLWLRIAYENIVLSHQASEAIAKSWCEDTEKKSATPCGTNTIYSSFCGLRDSARCTL